jgi:photosystem II stability/assembly factor-like uncharacterized protein
MTKYFLHALAMLSISAGISISEAQTRDNETKNYKEIPYWIDMMQDPKANFFETQKAFNEYWKDREVKKGSGYKPFKRWENFMAPQVDEFGNKPTAQEFQAQWNWQLSQPTVVPPTTFSTNEGPWRELGPINLPNNETGQPNGLGRVNTIEFHPTDENTFWVGAPSGGLWKTTDGGSSWSSNTDNLATLGVSSIVIDHTTTDIMYFGSGDRDGGDAIGLGVFKSLDGGNTWTVSSNGMGSATVGELMMHPTNNQILLAATSSGVYRSTDAGATWSNSNFGNFKDIKFHPTNPDIVYATASGDFYKSTDNGQSFNQITTIPGFQRMVIAVSPAAPNDVYVLASENSAFGGLYKSTDSGTNFTVQSTTPNILDYSFTGSGSGGQGWYDLTLVAHPTQANTIYAGGINLWKSTDGGSNWTISSHWVGSGGNPAVHADQHYLKYSPTNNKLYACNDGGVYVKNTPNSWTDISDGLAIAQCYKLGQAKHDSNKVMLGFQDNGTGFWDNGVWKTVMGGDGMECIVDPNNSDFVYGSLYYGDIRRSSNGGNWFTQVGGEFVNGINESGAWVTPFGLSEFNSNTMFAGFEDVWRSTNIQGAANWEEISDNLGGSSKMRVLEMSRANQNIIYAAKGGGLFKTSNALASPASSVTWSTLTVPGFSTIRAIETDPDDENIVYITRGIRVYKSIDGGTNWTDISSNISNSQNKKTLVYSNIDNHKALYIATDWGVWYLIDGETDWIDYSDGLPTYSKITELEIYEDQTSDNHLLRASTYGRGLWSRDLKDLSEGLDVTPISQDICLNDTAVFNLTGADSYFWQVGGSLITIDSVFSVTPVTDSTFLLGGITATNDTLYNTVSVNIINDFDLEILGGDMACGQTVSLTTDVANPSDYSFNWSTGDTTASIFILPNSDTTITVELTHKVEGCIISDTHQLFEPSLNNTLTIEMLSDNAPQEISWKLQNADGVTLDSINAGQYTLSNNLFTKTIGCITDSCLTFTITDAGSNGVCCSSGNGHVYIKDEDGDIIFADSNYGSSSEFNHCFGIPDSLWVDTNTIHACPGEIVTFKAYGSTNYIWKNTNGQTISTVDSLNISADTTSIFAVFGDNNSSVGHVLVDLVIEDFQNPISNLKSNSNITIDNNGNAIISFAQIDSASTDDCSIDSVYINPSVFDCSDVGTQKLFVSIYDAFGNMTYDSTHITISDNTSPTISTVDSITLSIDASGIASLTTAMVNQGSTDNCDFDPNTNLSLSKTTFNCSNVGTLPIQVFATDASGNQATPSVVWVTVKPFNTNSSINKTICQGESFTIEGETFSTNGVHSVTTTNSIGCDSVIEINLDVITFDLDVTINGFELEANQAGAEYQWLNCPSMTEIGEANGQTFEATENGNYAVQITYNGCVDTSSCFEIKGIGISDVEINDVVILPNPFKDVISIEFDSKQNGVSKDVSIINSLGQTVYQSETSKQKLEIKTEKYAKGVYYIQIDQNGETKTYSVIKE